MVTDKYGNKMFLGWNEYSVEVFDTVQPLELNINYKLKWMCYYYTRATGLITCLTWNSGWS